MRVRFGSTILTALVAVLAMLILSNCGGEKEKVDPVVTIKARIPIIERSLNIRDLETLAKIGTKRFNPGKFADDVFAHGVYGDVELRFQRVRIFPDEGQLILIANFGPSSVGGIKELTLNLATKDFLLDAYSLRDRSLPPKPDQDNMLEHEPSDSSSATDPS